MTAFNNLVLSAGVITLLMGGYKEAIQPTMCI